MLYINKNICLNHYPQINCQHCEGFCPEKALTNLELNSEKCIDCGLCTAICPVDAIISGIDYQDGLDEFTYGEGYTTLSCQKQTLASKFPCLGFLDRRVLWVIGSQKVISIDISQCASCNPPVYDYLLKELEACNSALSRYGLLPISEAYPPHSAETPDMGRRGFFAQFFNDAKTTIHTARELYEERGSLLGFSSAKWSKANAISPVPADFTLHITIDTSRCNTCGLCVRLCGSQSLNISAAGDDAVTIKTNPLACKGCGLCAASCPTQAIGFSLGFQLSFTAKMPHCSKCGRPFQPTDTETMCGECSQDA